MGYKWNEYNDLDRALDRILHSRNHINELKAAFNLIGNNDKIVKELDFIAEELTINYDRAYHYLKQNYKPKKHPPGSDGAY